MKGVVFTEFLRMVEQRFGYEVADRIVTENELPSGGVYTSVGTYDSAEMGRLIGTLGKTSGMDAQDLQEAFGRYLFPRFAEGYPELVQGVTDPLAFLASIEDHIHVEVLKLYPDAELPRFETRFEGPDRIVMTYHSKRRMGHFALGLIKACGEHFGTDLDVRTEWVEADGTVMRFHVSRRGA
jgi:hypothetical protein